MRHGIGVKSYMPYASLQFACFFEGTVGYLVHFTFIGHVNDKCARAEANQGMLLWKFAFSQKRIRRRMTNISGTNMYDLLTQTCTCGQPTHAVMDTVPEPCPRAPITMLSVLTLPQQASLQIHKEAMQRRRHCPTQFSLMFRRQDKPLSLSN